LFFVIVIEMKDTCFVLDSGSWNKYTYKMFNIKSPVHFIKSALVLLYRPPWFRQCNWESMYFLFPLHMFKWLTKQRSVFCMIYRFKIMVSAVKSTFIICTFPVS
jgi:hypothetical protein